MSIVDEDLLRRFYRLFYSVSWFKWSVKKHCLAKVLIANSETFLHEKIRNYSSFRFSYKFAFTLFLLFLANQKQESGFQQVGGLVTRNTSVFCLQRIMLYVRAMPNSIDFFKGIFLHVLPVRIIIVPCFGDCFLSHVISGRRCFYLKLVVTLRFFQLPYCCFLWDKCSERSPYFTLSSR